MSEIMAIAFEVTLFDIWTFYIFCMRVYCAVQNQALNVIQVNGRL
jgi:hypothetical protein